MEDHLSASLASEPLEREIDVLRLALDRLRQRLPRSWSSFVVEDTKIHGRPVDAQVEITSPDDRSALFIAEVRRVLVTRDLAHILEQLRSTAYGSDVHLRPLIVARYLSASAQTWMAERDVSYVDATGNMRVSADRPGLYLRDVGAVRDPWRGPGRPRATLSGPPAARVVRALIDFRPPITMSDLIELSGTSTGAAYRVVEFLEEDALIERAAWSDQGSILATASRPLVQRLQLPRQQYYLSLPGTSGHSSFG